MARLVSAARLAQRSGLGRRGEDLAARHLRRRGYRLLDRNHRTRFGEIDLVGVDRETLVFVEVKTHRVRGDGAACGAGSSVDELGWPAARQRRRLRGLALAWLAQHPRRPPQGQSIRFDAVRVFVDARGELVSLEHLEGVL